MCLAIPGRVIKTLKESGLTMADVSFGGVVKRVCLEYVPDATPGDYVLVHVGFALSKVDEQEAQRIFKLLNEIGQLRELNGENT